MSAKLIIGVGGFKDAREANKALRMIEEGDLSYDELIELDENTVTTQVLEVIDTED